MFIDGFHFDENFYLIESIWIVLSLNGYICSSQVYVHMFLFSKTDLAGLITNATFVIFLLDLLGVSNKPKIYSRVPNLSCTMRLSVTMLSFSSVNLVSKREFVLCYWINFPTFVMFKNISSLSLLSILTFIGIAITRFI